jgi:tetratricopeptide (TPR) repeat protein
LRALCVADIAGRVAACRSKYELGVLERNLSEIVQTKKELWGRNTFEISQNLASLALVYYMQGKLSEAASSCRELISIHETKSDLSDRHIASLHHRLGQVHEAQGNLEEAEFFYRSSIDMTEDEDEDDEEGESLEHHTSYKVSTHTRTHARIHP